MKRPEPSRRRPDWRWERRAASAGFGCVAGVDEVGRGCLAGPVVAAAVVLKNDQDMPGLRDSKMLSPMARERWAKRLWQQARAWAVGQSDAAEVDRLNILQATRLAMERAVRGLPDRPDLLLVDAIELPALDLPQGNLVRGDERVMSIAAASVIAKVHRDRLMCRLDPRFPHYGFSRNKGYGTLEHRLAVRRWGPCELHRRSFCGVSPA